jgi:hypothetical protein
LGFNREGGPATFWDLEGEMKSKKGWREKGKERGHGGVHGPAMWRGRVTCKCMVAQMTCLEEEGQKRSKR